MTERIVLEDRWTYPEKAKWEPRPGDMSGHLQLTRIDMLVTDKSVTVRSVSKHVGRTKDDKIWSKWSWNHKTSYVFRKRKDGLATLNVLDISMQPGRLNGNKKIATFRYENTPSRTDLTRPYLTYADQIYDKIDALASVHLGRTLDRNLRTPIFHLMYPSLEILVEPQKAAPVQPALPAPQTQYLWGNDYAYVAPLIVNAFRDGDIASVTRQIFGNCRYRKDLVKAVAFSRLNVLNDYSVFTGLVPVDWQIEALNWHKNATEERLGAPWFDRREDVRKFRKMLSQMNMAQRRSMLLSYRETQHWAVSDTMRMLRMYPQYAYEPTVLEARTFTELHDAVSDAMNVRYRRNEEPRDIEQTAGHKIVDNLQAGGYRFITAKNTSTMYEWSEHMNNCIRSYDRAALSGDGIYLGLYDEKDKVIANVELVKASETSYELRQILGKFNAKLPADILTASIEALRSTGIVRERSLTEAWGVK